MINQEKKENLENKNQEGMKKHTKKKKVKNQK